MYAAHSHPPRPIHKDTDKHAKTPTHNSTLSNSNCFGVRRGPRSATLTINAEAFDSWAIYPSLERRPAVHTSTCKLGESLGVFMIVSTMRVCMTTDTAKKGNIKT